MSMHLDTISISISWKRASVLNDNTSFIYIISICIQSLHSESTNNLLPRRQHLVERLHTTENKT